MPSSPLNAYAPVFPIWAVVFAVLLGCPEEGRIYAPREVEQDTLPERKVDPPISKTECDDKFMALAVSIPSGGCMSDDECLVLRLSLWYQARDQVLNRTEGPYLTSHVQAYVNQEAGRAPYAVHRKAGDDSRLRSAAAFAAACPDPPGTPTVDQTEYHTYCYKGRCLVQRVPQPDDPVFPVNDTVTF